jgi:HEAT repeat protein
MGTRAWLVELDQVHSSYLFLAVLACLVAATAVLYQIGVLGWVLGVLGQLIRAGVRKGFHVWEVLLGWAAWPIFFAIGAGLLLLGATLGDSLPGLRILCGLALLIMGTLACLAYMFIDLERYEVERGYKAVYNPLKGQELAVHLARYGHQVGIPLLICATLAAICGFAMLNQGFYQTFGAHWYMVSNKPGDAQFVDFLTYALLNLFGIVDVLDLARTSHIARFEHVKKAAWPAATLLVGFRLFFTLVLLQQIFASLRQGKLLAETITDFWSPHEPIRERAEKALPQYGAVAIRPLLASLRSVASLTKEQRDQLPIILAAIGPTIMPDLKLQVNDANEHVRAIAAATFGHLQDANAIALLSPLISDPSEMVRQCAVEALGSLGSMDKDQADLPSSMASAIGLRWRKMPRLFHWKPRGDLPIVADPIGLAVSTLETALGDESAGVRGQALVALGKIGRPAARAVPRVIELLNDQAELVRCQAAEGLVHVEADGKGAVAALMKMLQDPSAPVKTSAARALGSLKKAAAPAVSLLVPLLQDHEEAVRNAAADAIAQVGPLNGADKKSLVKGLTSEDNVVRAQTAQALGTIGAAAGDAAPALVEAMDDPNDRVRAKAVEALGKIGEDAADVAVPSLVVALHDQDNWVSALAAEALGEMGESADEAVPALIHSLKHVNPLVRANAAEALGKMGQAAAGGRHALENAASDEDGPVRSHAMRALGAIGKPTSHSASVVHSGFQDPDPLVRAAAVEAVEKWGESNEMTLQGLMPLLEDANEQVKIEAIKALPKLAAATPSVLSALSKSLLEDGNSWVQVQAALALGNLGAGARAAGGALLRAVQTGEESVREQALRAMARIQPPESEAAFLAGLNDASAVIRMVASAGWIKAAEITEDAIPPLVEALRDPEVKVRSNAAQALGRLEVLPADAIPLLMTCAGDASDSLRVSAALALKRAPAGIASETMRTLLADSNGRVRLIAASALLSSDPSHAEAGAALQTALSDPDQRIRKAALELAESLGRTSNPQS